jgi:hypothetical protein
VPTCPKGEKKPNFADFTVFSSEKQPTIKYSTSKDYNKICKKFTKRNKIILKTTYKCIGTFFAICWAWNV